MNRRTTVIVGVRYVMCNKILFEWSHWWNESLVMDRENGKKSYVLLSG